MHTWLTENGVTHVAMESTGIYWRPVYNVLEGAFELLLVNARRVKGLPGRKTDVKDSQWLAQLLEHGLLRGSFVPPEPIRDLRDLTRYRKTLIQERSSHVNRLAKTLELANIKLGSVATDIMGKSGRAMIEALLADDVPPDYLAKLARGSLKKKHDRLVPALRGRLRPHHKFLLFQQLQVIDGLTKASLNSTSASRNARALLMKPPRWSRRCVEWRGEQANASSLRLAWTCRDSRPRIT